MIVVVFLVWRRSNNGGFEIPYHPDEAKSMQFVFVVMPVARNRTVDSEYVVILARNRSNLLLKIGPCVMVLSLRSRLLLCGRQFCYRHYLADFTLKI